MKQKTFNSYINKFKSLHWFLKLFVIFLILSLFFIILSLINGILPANVISNSSVRGFIIRDQVWEGEVKITGDLLALPGTTIFIKPGTKILISSSYDFNNYDVLPWHLKVGINTGPIDHGILTGEPYWDETEKVQVRLWNVFARGTKEQPISIASIDQPGNIYAMNLIRIQSGQLLYINFSDYRRLEIGPNVVIKNSNFKYTGECAICIKRGEPLIEQNSFQNGKKVFIEVGFASPIIQGNEFVGVEGDGILYSGVNRAEIRLIGNKFHLPNKKALIVASGRVGGNVTKNFFDIGSIVIPCRSKINFESNYLKSKIYFRNPESCQGDYIVGANFWDIIDRKSIESNMFVGQTPTFRIIVPQVLETAPF